MDCNTQPRGRGAPEALCWSHLGVSAQLVMNLSSWAVLSVCFTYAGRIGHSLQEELCQPVGMSPALNQVWLPILLMVAST